MSTHENEAMSLASVPGDNDDDAAATMTDLSALSSLQRINTTTSTSAKRTSASHGNTLDGKLARLSIGGDVDPELVRLQRGWVAGKMRDREDEFAHREEITVYSGTFNVNGKRPLDEDLTPWLTPGLNADLLVVGFQEVDLSTEAMLRYTKAREDMWLAALHKVLDVTRHGYEKVTSRQLVGVLMIVFVRRDRKHRITDVVSAERALTLVANKSACAVRLRYNDTTLVFVCAHLSAFTNQYSRRNAEYADIVHSLVFPSSSGCPHLLDPSLLEDEEGNTIFHTDLLIFSGDLNYRLGELERAEAFALIAEKQHGTLLHFDQLKAAQEHGHAFQELKEEEIQFGPSYKFDPGTLDSFDNSEKQRVPAYTDRVLYLSAREADLKQTKYETHYEVKMSDHKPVSALFKAQVKRVKKDEQARVQKELLDSLVDLNSDEPAEVTLLPGPSVEFATVSYNTPQTFSLTLKNTGSSSAPWRFVAKPDTVDLLPPWLSIEPMSGIVLPGQEQSILLTLLVDKSIAGQYNLKPEGEREIADLLVLSTRKRDLFLSVSAREYQPSCYGNSLEELYRLGKPIRTATTEELKALQEPLVPEGGGKEKKAGGSAPAELRRLVNLLIAEALDVEELFLLPGDKETMDQIRECLDTGDQFPRELLAPPAPAGAGAASPAGPSTPMDDGEADLSSMMDIIVYDDNDEAGRVAGAGASRQSLTKEESAAELRGIHSLANALLEFLGSLKEPVVPYESYWDALTAGTREEAYRLVDTLPGVNANTFLYLTAFIKILARQSSSSSSAAQRSIRLDRLAIAFSLVLLRAPPFSPPVSPTSVASTPLIASPPGGFEPPPNVTVGGGSRISTVSAKAALVQPQNVNMRKLEFLRYFLIEPEEEVVTLRREGSGT